MRVALPLLIACNNAPLDYLSDGSASNSGAAWDHPTSQACDDRDEGGEIIDGFELCAQQQALRIVPIDDPILVPCAEAEFPAEVDAFWAFDGAVAKAYPIPFLRDRELVHDDFGDEPVLVDY